MKNNFKKSCKESDNEWKRIKKLSRLGIWELIESCYIQEKIWKSQYIK